MSLQKLIDQGIKLQQAGNLVEARSCYEQVLAEEPNHASALHLLGLTFLGEPIWELGVKFIKRAIILKPRTAVFHYNLGVAYRDRGEFEPAQEAFRRAVEVDPSYGEAWGAVAVTRRFQEGGDVLEGILSAIERTDQQKNLRCLHFAAGKIFDDIGDYDRAFQHFSSGNALAPAEWDADSFRATCNSIRAATPRAFFEARAGWGIEEARPLFIIGLPRSGSSLVEQILSSHPELAAVGEIPQVKYISRGLGERLQPQQGYPNSLHYAPAEFYSGYGQAYLDEINGLIGAPGFRSVDKALNNFLFVVVIRLMFPRASIIHSMRHPVDTGLSCFMQNFDHPAVKAFSSRLEWIAEYYRGCQDLMAHWREVLPGGIIDMEYERLVSEPEAATRALLDACDLDWHEGCLDFAANQRRVGTASAWQVRQSLYTSSMQRWRSYEKHLGPLVGLVDYSPSP